MAMIVFRNLTFCYEGGTDNLFENLTLTLDTDWRLGLVGRNGRGKTTLLRLLCGELSAAGEAVQMPLSPTYFPFSVPDESLPAWVAAAEGIAPYRSLEEQMDKALKAQDYQCYQDLEERYSALSGYTVRERIFAEGGGLGLTPQLLERPFCTLSGGERTKVRIAALFLRRDSFVLLDEPTNHLDTQGRQVLGDYLSGKRSFILVSHDRELLCRATDHTLSINRRTVELVAGNYDVWQQQYQRREQFEKSENQRLGGEIKRLSQSARQRAEFAQQCERSKKGRAHAVTFDGGFFDRGFVGHKAAKSMKRAKSIEARQHAAIEEKKTLLYDVEEESTLTVTTRPTTLRRLCNCRELVIDFGQGPLFSPLSFTVEPGERVALVGANGSGKSSVIGALLGAEIPHTGEISHPGSVRISSLSQLSKGVEGTLPAFCQREGIERTALCTWLRKLGLPREQLERPLCDYSAGQKRKLLLAASILTPAELLIWDEPLNYLDILTREQLEAAVLAGGPTLLFVEHDRRFIERIATKMVVL